MTEPAHPSVRSTEPQRERLAELRGLLGQGRYQVPADRVADRILTNLTTPQPEDASPLSGSDRTAFDLHPDTDVAATGNRHGEPTIREAPPAVPSPAEVLRYQDWVQQQRRLEDGELSELGAVLTTEEVRRYHGWVQEYRRLEDAELGELLDSPGG